MAIFHLNFKILTRTTKEGKSKSSLYLAAYNNRERLTDEKTGLIFDYTKKREDLYFSNILLPDNAPPIFKNRAELWGQVEAIERRKDSQLARYFIIGLQKELSPEANKKLLEDYLNKNFIRRGMIADYAIHDINSNNPHAHIMLTMRKVNQSGFEAKKAREWNDPKLVEIWRRSWAVMVNKSFRENNINSNISNLSHLRKKEIYINEAKKLLDKNELEKAEYFINAVDDLNKKPPQKRKPRQEYIKDKKRKAKNGDIRQRIKQQQKQKEETIKKESKLKLLFNNLILRFNNKTKKEDIKKISDLDFILNIKNEEDKKEDLELKNYINEELKNDKKDNITHKPRRDRIDYRNKKDRKI